MSKFELFRFDCSILYTIKSIDGPNNDIIDQHFISEQSLGVTTEDPIFLDLALFCTGEDRYIHTARQLYWTLIGCLDLKTNHTFDLG